MAIYGLYHCKPAVIPSVISEEPIELMMNDFAHKLRTWLFLIVSWNRITKTTVGSEKFRHKNGTVGLARPVKLGITKISITFRDTK